MAIRARAHLLQHVTGGVAAFAVMAAAGMAAATPIVFQVGGTNLTASIQPTVDAFRAALGNPNNGNAPGPIVGGRREINWDGGGGVSTTTAPVTPFNTFLNTRGAQFTTSGAGLTQATPDGLATLASNPGYATTFGAFSPLRLFAPIGSNVTDATFFVPGTNGTHPAMVSGFGAVFTDVDVANVTQLQFFDAEGNLFSTFSVPAGTVADASLSFLGVVFDAGELISRVRITTGTTALGPNDNPGGGVDVVAMDDFLYAEPVGVAEPAPGGATLLGAAIALLLRRARRRDRGN
jgi:hypothetical protein